jgi:hypothetical protein
LFVLVTATLLGVSSMQAAPTGYERKAFEGRYGLWSRVQCISDSIRVVAETDNSLLSQMELDARSQLARLGVPKMCDPSATPAPATMVSMELEIRTVAVADGSLAYFVQLRAEMPDGELVKTSFGQRTSWESTGKLGTTDPGHSRDQLRAALSEQIEEFATFMQNTRTTLNEG